MHEIVNYIIGIVSEMGYGGIFIMMVIESSFFPFPSEVAMVPAGYLASIGKMNFFISFCFGTAGALVGASINYFLGKHLGSKVIKRLISQYGKYIFLSQRHYEVSEKYFHKHGVITTFLARFIPAVRQLISIPAGVFRMNYSKFLFYTGLGAGIWNLILMCIGYVAGENKDLIAEYSKEALIGSLFLVCIIAFIYSQVDKAFEEKIEKEF